MSVTNVAVIAGTYLKSWNVTSSADGDLTGVITHGFLKKYVATAPALVFLTPLQPQYHVHQWSLGAVSSTTITVNCISAAGAGLAGTPQLQVVAMLPNSLMD